MRSYKFQRDKLLRYCDWVIGAFLILFVFWSPISITGAQAAISFAFLFWVVRMFLVRKFQLARNPLNIPIAAFLFVAGVGVVTAVDFEYSLKSYMSLTWIVIFFLIVNNVNDIGQFKKIMGVLILIVTVAGVYGIFQHLTRIDFFGNIKYLHKSLARSPGFFNSPQTFGNYLLLALPMVIGLSFHSGGREKRWLQFSGIPILAGILFSYVRGVWVGVIGGLIVMGILRSKKFLFSVLAAIIVIVLIFALVPSLKFSRRLVMETFGSERPVGDRIYFWKGSLKIIRDYPVTGSGWEGFRLVYPKYEPKASQQPACHAHNNFLDIAVGSGLLGLGVFLWLLIVIYKYGLYIYKHCENGYFKGIAWGFLGSFTAFLIAGLSQYNFGDSEVVMLFYFLLGMVMVIPKVAEATSNKGLSS